MCDWSFFAAYNPNLGEVTRATRQAYVKFMVPKIKKDKDDAPDTVQPVETASELRRTMTHKSTVSNERHQHKIS
jgi:transcriptional regulator of NAD metabolism